MSVTLLGPQRLAPNVAETLHSLGVRGPIATITSGWEERELEDDELAEHCGGTTENLQLWERLERVFDRDPELRQTLWRHHDRLRAMQKLYRLRLNHAMDAARELAALDVDPTLLVEEHRCAIEAVRKLDLEHLERITAVHEAFEAEIDAENRPSLSADRAEVRLRISDAAALAVAGGHVAVLLNRLRLFGIADAARTSGLPVIAWSAGAMALGERVMLFHDRPPQGRGNAEVFEPGIALYRGAVPFPHARRRLLLDDPARVELLARRLDPLLAIPMDEGARIDWDGDAWSFRDGTRRLAPDGTLSPVGAVA